MHGRWRTVFRITPLDLAVAHHNRSTRIRCTWHRHLSRCPVSWLPPRRPCLHLRRTRASTARMRKRWRDTRKQVRSYRRPTCSSSNSSSSRHISRRSSRFWRLRFLLFWQPRSYGILATASTSSSSRLGVIRTIRTGTTSDNHNKAAISHNRASIMVRRVRQCQTQPNSCTRQLSTTAEVSRALQTPDLATRLHPRRVQAAGHNCLTGGAPGMAPKIEICASRIAAARPCRRRVPTSPVAR